MTDEGGQRAGAILIEDVILTLANIRSSLPMLAEPGGLDPAARSRCLDRIERQITLLEDRARSVNRPAATVAPAAVAVPFRSRRAASG